ncbi:MAG: hypothetical protein M3066_19595, partial [Actinomycetota bacterium]|nr:hypothetical protein [Actinomycetota bacterium]
MAVKVLRRMAATAPAPVFVARGGGAGLLPLELAADPRVTLVASPRHASVLLAAGRFPGAMGEALGRVHDQLLRARITVWWTADADAGRPAALPAASVVTGADPVDAVLSAHRNTVLGDAGAEDAVGADEPPNPFEGRGDYGQGGEGMMGGVPFGRPMAMTGDDRDGLALDRLTVTFGPFLPGFGNGLRLRAVLQGGVVQEAEVELLDLGTGPWLPGLDPDDHVRHDLRWLAEALRLGGLPALGCRSAMLARTGPGAPVLAGLARRVR